MPNCLFYLNSLDRTIFYIRRVWLNFIIIMVYGNFSELNATGADPDQTPRSVASDLGLHRLPMFLLWDARLKWANRDSSYDRIA